MLEDRDELLISAHDSKTLYNCSPMRANILAWYDFKEGATALEINPECQAITEFLLEAGLNVSSADEKTLFSIGEKYDYVFLIGAVDERLIEGAKLCLKEDGTLFISLANREGLMYKNGLPNYYTGKSFDSLKHRDGSHSIGYGELGKLLEKTGISDSKWFYPYPDYRLANEIFSDDRLPQKGLVTEASPSYQGDYIISIDEPAEFDRAVEENRVQEVMNSFLVVWSPKGNDAKKVSYVKFNSLRAPEFRLYTLIGQDGQTKYVEKRAMDPRAIPHLLSIEEKYNCISESFNMLSLVPYEKTEKGIKFEYVEGRPFLGEVDYTKLDSAVGKIEACMNTIFSTELENIRPFEITDEYRKIFAETCPLSLLGQDGLVVSNPDSIFDNFILGDQIYCLDYEWMFSFLVPLKYLKYRTLHYLYRRDVLKLMDLKIQERDFLRHFGYTEDEIADCESMELSYQQYVHGKDLRYAYLAHYKWRAWTKAEWKKEKSLSAKIKRKLFK